MRMKIRIDFKEEERELAAELEELVVRFFEEKSVKIRKWHGKGLGALISVIRTRR